MKRILLVVFGLAVLTAHGATPRKRKVTIPWRAVESALQYDFQLSRTSDMDPLLFRKNYPQTQTQLELAPGTYYYRVRGLLEDGKPGPWSEVQGFVVNLAATAPLRPENLEVFKDPIDEAGIDFEWGEGEAGTEYWIRIRDKNGVVLERSVNKTTFKWMPPKYGIYEWQAGYSTPSGKEWSDSFKFAVKKSALPVSVLATLGESRDEEEDQGDPNEWWGSLSLSQLIIAYNTASDSSGQKLTSSAAALAGQVGLGIAWKGSRPPGGDKRYFVDFSGSAARQLIVGVPFLVTRATLRGFRAVKNAAWWFGPFLEVGYHSQPIFIVSPDNTVAAGESGQTSRYHGGAGGKGILKSSRTMDVEVFGLIRYDFGGKTAFSGKLNGDFGFEGGAGLALKLGPRSELGAFLKFTHDEASWRNEFNFVQNNYLTIGGSYSVRL